MRTLGRLGRFTLLAACVGCWTLGSLTLGDIPTSRAGEFDWPGWQGPNRDAVSLETGLLQSWPKDGPRRLWVFSKAGKGYSGPAIVDGTMFIMGTEGEGDQEHEVLFALDVDRGELLWKTAVGELLKNNWGDGPRATPTVDGKFVYTLGGQGELLCVRASDGHVEWQRSLTKDFEGKRPNWGYTESVLIDGDQLICCPGGKTAPIVALDKKTGKERWRAKDVNPKVHYASVIKISDPPTYVKLTMSEVVGLNPENGELRWKVDFPGRTAVIPTPVYHQGHLFITAGYGVGCKLIRIEGSSAKEVYFNKVMKNHHGGVLRIGEHIYGYSDGGGWTCMDMISGEAVWRERKKLGKGAVTYADKRLYCLDERNGDVVLAGATPESWKEYGRFRLAPQSDIRSPRGKIWTHPVISNGRLYLRDQEHIYCFDISAK